MKTIYNFKQRIKEDPEYIRKAHELTLNTTKPKAGLKGLMDYWAQRNGGTILKTDQFHKKKFPEP